MPTLPLELLLLIADYLDRLPLLALSRSCHSLHHLLTPLLHTHVPNLASTVVPWAARNHRLDLLQLALPHLPRRYVISKSHQDGLLSRLISAGDIEIVRVLLRNRMVDPEGGGWPGRVRPLLTAVYARNLEVIKLLLDAGASVGLGNPAPAEVVWRLERRHDGEMMGLLKKARPGNKWLERLGDQNDEFGINFLIDRELARTS